MTKINSTYWASWITCIILLFSACKTSSNEQTNSDFDKLCEIYKDTVGEYNSENVPNLKLNELVLRIEKEIPNIMNDYKHISNARRKDRYQLFKQVAEENTKKWDCPIMESYYSNNQNH